MKLIFVRHGQTNYNAQDIIQGQSESTLSEKGLSQAKALAKRLKNENIDMIFCSDLMRARQTAKEIIKYHKKVPVKYTKLLRERAFGVFENRHVDVYRTVRESVGKKRHNFKPQGGESFYDLQKRVRKFYASIYPKYKGKTVLVVSHGGINRVLTCMFMKKPLKRVFDIDQNNANVNIVEITKKGKAIIRTLNCTKHL